MRGRIFKHNSLFKKALDRRKIVKLLPFIIINANNFNNSNKSIVF